MDPLRILILAAHPDDGELRAGGTAALWCERGHHVRFVSVTDGGAGHQTLRGRPLSQRRRYEAAAAAAVIGATSEVLDFPDGELMPSLEARRWLICLLRDFYPDLVLTHRPNDYHPDHRYTATLVQDAAYLVTVPALCPDTPALSRNPVILYLADDFKRPVPFRPDLVVDVGGQMGKLVDMLHCHGSQFYEWLPFNGGYLDQVPDEDAARRAWLDKRIRGRIRPLADRYRTQVVQTYGPTLGPAVEYVEAFEVSEYGSPLDDERRARLFPFLPPRKESHRPKAAQDWADVRADD